MPSSHNDTRLNRDRCAFMWPRSARRAPHQRAGPTVAGGEHARDTKLRRGPWSVAAINQPQTRARMPSTATTCLAPPSLEPRPQLRECHPAGQVGDDDKQEKAERGQYATVPSRHRSALSCAERGMARGKRPRQNGDDRAPCGDFRAVAQSTGKRSGS